jgi:hypothetical protein
MHAIDYADKLRNTNIERDLAKRLRASAEEERFAFISEMLDVHVIVALELANTCLRDRDLLKRFLEQGLARVKDLSSIDLWLKYLIPRIGIRGVIAVLRENLDDHPIPVASAVYFLPRYIKEEDASGATSFQDFYEATKEKGERVPELQKFFQRLPDLTKFFKERGLASTKIEKPQGMSPPVFCPRCNAVLMPWDEDMQQQTCFHCGEKIARG